jgi:hypothetical protein
MTFLRIGSVLTQKLDSDDSKKSERYARLIRKQGMQKRSEENNHTIQQP